MHLGMNAISLRRGGMATLLLRLELSFVSLNHIF